MCMSAWRRTLSEHMQMFLQLAIRGAMEMVHIDVACWFVQDTLKGDNVTELRVKYLRKIVDSVPPGDED